MQIIIYNEPSGLVAVISPAPEALAQHGIDAIARKDVPAGRRYRIIDDSELPADWSLQAAWTCNESDLTDGVGAVSHEFEEAS